MNANELLEIGEHLQSLNDDNLAQRVFDGTEVQNFIGGSLEILSRTRIRVTAEEKPCEEHTDTFARVLAYDCTSMTWELVWFEDVADEDGCRYTLWTQLPEVTP